MSLKAVGSFIVTGMVIIMDDAKLKTLTQVEEFLKGEQGLFCVAKDERYPLVQRTLTRFGYEKLGRKEKCVVLRYLERMTGLSRQEFTRLVRKFQTTEEVRLGYRPPKRGFRRIFGPQDVTLLAEMDERHGALSGPATKKLMERACEIYGDKRYETLSRISVSHLYNLREGRDYVSKRRHWTKTRSTKAPIGERRPPRPEGAPGYLRIDSVHQGDQDGQKGVYHINAVDSVTQYQVVATCEKISEAYLIPVLEEILESFLLELTYSGPHWKRERVKKIRMRSGRRQGSLRRAPFVRRVPDPQKDAGCGGGSPSGPWRTSWRFRDPGPGTDRESR